MDKPDHAFNNQSFYAVKMNFMYARNKYLCGKAKHQCMQDIVESDEAINNTETDSKFQRPLELPRSSGKFAELLHKIRRKEINKRSEFRVPFHINDELTIGIVGYVFNRKCVSLISLISRWSH